MKVLIVIVAILAMAVAARPVCHNITGTCTAKGFECVSGEVVTHAQRCNGVEDCSDGTDEFMCDHEDHRPLFERTPEERHAFEQTSSCVNCNCAATAYTVSSGTAWWAYAVVSHTDTALMTGTPATYGGQPCNWKCVSAITIGFYRKNRICRGWLCCSRQRQCVTCLGTGGCVATATGNRCY